MENSSCALIQVAFLYLTGKRKFFIQTHTYAHTQMRAHTWNKKRKIEIRKLFEKDKIY